MKVYRTHYNLPPLPSPAETDIPLVGDIYAGRRPASVTVIYRVIVELCRRAAQTVEDPWAREQLENASPHWLRHTSASDQLNEAKLPLLVVSKNHRHANISTTAPYLHVERSERHDAVQAHHLPKTESAE
jgi:integrase/recombinase XerD